MNDESASAAVRIGADVGGTFTDVVLIDEQGRLWTHKVPSTPPDFDRAVLLATQHLLRVSGMDGSLVREVAHGTTVATNAVSEQRGARTALITTRGFRDVLELRRVKAPQLYDLSFEKPPTLIERHLRLEASERVSADGEVLVPLAHDELGKLVDRLRKEDVESLAVCFLHAYAYSDHERSVGDFLKRHLPDVPVSLSHEVLPERREYERTATTVINAYVQPLMQRYLGSLRSGLNQLSVDAPLHIMQSAGGLTPEQDAAERPVFVLESGPAAGVLAAAFVASRVGIDNAITLDMGGTTAKASMIEAGTIAYSSEYEVGASLSAGNRLVGGGGDVIRAPSIDIAEVGAGGGSVAWLDSAGGLRVGPRSAGAEPGPACYERGGTEATLTDANVLLGYIRSGTLADGGVNIDPIAAERAVHDQIAVPLGMDLLQAADGIHRIANAQTMRALRQVSSERGRDPRDFSLIAFGGSGPVHAAGLARELHTKRIVIPPLPGLFSALGLLVSGIEHHDVRSCQLVGEGLNAEMLGNVRDELREEMLRRFGSEGYKAEDVEMTYSVDVRFQGQTSRIRVPVASDLTPKAVTEMCLAFEEEHERVYGHRSDPDNPIEVVAARLVGRAGVKGIGESPRAAELENESGGSRGTYFDGVRNETPVLSRSAIEGTVEGPLLIDEYDSTIVVPPGVRVLVDEHNNLVMELTSG